MAWSTSQLADLAGVTLRSIRHWHEIGILPEPERLTNGYKQYTARHLVLVLRIARLTGFGFTLEDIARMLDSEEQGQESMRGLRAELDTRIAELERIRSEVDHVIGLGVSPDVSPEALLAMEALGHDPVSRNVAIVMAHLTPKEDTITFVETFKDAPVEFANLNTAIWGLPADAEDIEITTLADRAVTTIKGFVEEHYDALPDTGNSRAERRSADALTAVATESMNRAQRRVMQRVVEQLANSVERRPTPP
ncbi:MerR family transcriptional regulator [Occultella kanbiaonis]|uniref:helix-turn-helix domain-containing protein n=1 Tax=Occultella kanbiaonis TaxID=2675754 RepID=UPI0013D5FB1C|nr:MerR family transcriptional regulator [Occultella kanbiaonis]